MTNSALPEEFLGALRELEESYLQETDPIRQCGFGGGAERWRRERGLILEAVDCDGDFLDVGCANGYLLECLVEWATTRGISLVPFGLDQGSRLIEVAKRRLPQYADHFWVGNAWDWNPPRRFRYVYTLTEAVPETHVQQYLRRLLDGCVERGGFLIVGAYGSMSKRQPAQDVTALLKNLGLSVLGSATCGDLPVAHVAWTRAEQPVRADR